VSFVRHRLTAVFCVVAAALLGGLCYTLIHSQRESRDNAKAELAGQARLAAKLTSALLVSTAGETSQEVERLSGPASGLQRALNGWSHTDPAPMWAVYDAGGRPLATAGATTDGMQIERPLVREAANNGVALSDIGFLPNSHTPVVEAAVAFGTGRGLRVLVEVAPARLLAFVSSYLTGASDVAGADEYLLDGAGRILGSSNGAAQGARPPLTGLAAAVAHNSEGDVGLRTFVAEPLRVASRWHVVFAVPNSALFAGVNSAEWISWIMFIGFALAVAGLIVLAAFAVRRSAQLAVERERARVADELASERLHDALTGLPNRSLFLQRAERALARERTAEDQVAVLFIDLDHFKRINDSLGHAAGDEVLRTLAERLRGAVRECDTVSRFGGDEFLILCQQLSGPEAARAVADRVRAAFDRPFDLGSNHVHLTCAVGIALAPEGDAHVDAATLVRDADAAMYDAKGAGGAAVRVFDAELHAAAIERLDTEPAASAPPAPAEALLLAA
jgi:diguanylate cyclase (GGDEF)-like protein